MRNHVTWKKRLNASTSDEVFRHLMGALTRSITTYAYFVNWSKVDENVRAVKAELHLLDSIVGNSDPEKALDDLLQRYPEVVRAFPTLLAVRHDPRDAFVILTKYAGGHLEWDEFDLSHRSKLTQPERAKLVAFARDSGILDLFRKRVTKSIPDYAVGVEVGIDTNGRKNRGGTLMETVVGEILDPMCQANKWKWMTQPTAAKVKASWGITIKDVQTAVRPDFGILTPKGLWLVETNFYNQQGSKLKATAGEYKGKFEACKAQGHHYLWITDGYGWKSSEGALRECFDVIDYTLNLSMCAAGCLEDILRDP